MYEAFPHSDYYEGSVTVSDIQEPHRSIAIFLWLSDLGNPHLDI